MSSKKEKTDQYYDVMSWAEARMTALDNRVESSKKPFMKKLHQGNANAIEEEFFDWISNEHIGKKSNVLFVPYHQDVSNHSA
jgi:hypothetical protein